MSRPKKGGQGVRRLVTISPKNTAFLQWWGEQESPSTSLALVLADWIERHGFVDVVNRPVRQLPRRGRPPTSDERVGSDNGRGERAGAEGTAGSRDFLDEDAARDADEPGDSRDPLEPADPVGQSEHASHEQPEQPEPVIPGDHGNQGVPVPDHGAREDRAPGLGGPEDSAPDRKVRAAASEPQPELERADSDHAAEPPVTAPAAIPVETASHTEPAVSASDHRSGTSVRAERTERTVNTDNTVNNAAGALSDGIPESAIPETLAPEQFDMNSIFGH